MKLKTLVKLNEIREHPSKILIHDCYNNEVCYLNVSEYLAFKDKEIEDWNITGTGSKTDNDDYEIEVWI